MTWKVEEIPALSGFTVEWAEPGNYFLSRGNRLYQTVSPEALPIEIGMVTVPSWQLPVARFRLAQRLLRFFVYNLVRLDNGDLFITFDKSVGIMRAGEYLPLKGLLRPCRVLRSGCAVDKSGNVFFGEYLANTERGEMRIYRYSPGSDGVETAYVFPAGAIRHVHGVYFDRFSDSIFCLTGDAAGECRILRTSDGFASVETVGSGDESWRAVSVLFDEKYFYYGTDAEFRDNQIIRVARKDLSRDTLGEVNGTVFFSKKLGDDLFFGTTAENAPSQKGNVAAIWHVSGADKVEKIVEFEKDLWHGGLFLFGTINFPFLNDLDDRLFFNTLAVKGENRTFCLVRT